MAFISEALVEEALLAQLEGLGIATLHDSVAGPDGSAPERKANGEVLLEDRLKAAIARLNPHIPEEARHDALLAVLAAGSQNLVEENRRLHQYLCDGVPVEYSGEDGTIRGDAVRLLAFDDPDANDWLAINQLAVVEAGKSRRPDVVLFVNGLPLAVFELKNPGSENATVQDAFNQLQTYKAEIPALFRSNAFLVVSDGTSARIGSLTADYDRFMPWRTTDGADIAPKGSLDLSVLVEGVFEKGRFLDLLRNFTVFRNDGSDTVKIIAGYHQFHAVHKAVDCTVTAIAPGGDRKVGVIWHTQGSGKSLLMAFYAGQLMRQAELENPTLVVVTDRNDLDDQLFGTFSGCRDLIRDTPVQADTRDDLRDLLDRASGGVIFTTIQKFSLGAGEAEYPVLTDRRNVVVVADEAHRSQYGLKARINRTTGALDYGFAKYLRDGLPNASFIGFTGTPIEADDVNTPAVFGNYIDIYDISRGVDDGATVPIYYESRLARIELPDEAKPIIDQEIEDLTEDEAATDQQRLQQKWATVEALVGSDKRIAMVAEDLVTHLEARLSALDGKAMVVCMSRRICVKLYAAIVALRPEWHSDKDDEGAIKVVMTGSASDPPEWQQHVGGKRRRDLLAKRAKRPDDALKLVLVRDMWLTGFDAPCMHTMYVDKPMRGHGLMQAIARVNRVFKDKPGGLIVDYIGIAQNLKKALGQYSASDQKQTGKDLQAEAVAEMLERYDVVRCMFHGFNYLSGLHGTAQQRLAMMAGALDLIFSRQQDAAAKETSEEEKKRALRRYQDAVLALSKAFALAAASDQAKGIRDEVAFFQTVRAAMVKTATINSGMTPADKQFAVQQIIDGAVVSTEIVDILAAAGLQSPDIAILSDEFLAEIQQMEKKNLALEALKKLLNDQIRSRSRSNVTEQKQFSERLEDAIARYHSNAISTAEVLQELINLAQELRASRERGEDVGLSKDEIAFYDALAENQSAVEIMGDDSLKVIAHELLNSLQQNITIDWAMRDSARARLRVLVKRILRRHGYPPDLQTEAVQTVLRQAEELSARWAA